MMQQGTIHIEYAKKTIGNPKEQPPAARLLLRLPIRNALLRVAPEKTEHFAFCTLVSKKGGDVKTAGGENLYIAHKKTTFFNKN